MTLFRFVKDGRLYTVAKRKLRGFTGEEWYEATPYKHSGKSFRLPTSTDLDHLFEQVAEG